MLVCRSCGVTLPDGASFCPNCGLQLTAENIGEPPKPLPPTGNADIAVTPETALLLSEQAAPQRGKWHFHPAHILLALPVLILTGLLLLIVVALNADPAVDEQASRDLFHEGLVPVLVGDGSSEPLWGYMDREGNQVIEGKFDQVQPFYSNGLAAVCQLGKWGFIDKSGAFVIPAIYEDAKNFGENEFAPVKANGSWGYINEDGVFVINPQFDSAEQFAENGLAMVQIGGKYVYINGKGVYVIPPQFDNAKSFGLSGFAAILAFGKWGMINEEGRYVITPQFDALYPFTESGLALIEKDGAYGYIDRTGIYVISPVFEYATSFDENGLALVKKNGKYGYIDKEGAFVIEAIYDQALPFSESDGLAAVCKDAKKGLWSYIDKNGKTVIDATYTAAGTFCNGLAAVRDAGGLYYIDEAGNERLRPKAECLAATDFSEDGYAIVWYLDQKGEEACVIVTTEGEVLGSVQLSMVHYEPITMIRAK